MVKDVVAEALCAISDTLNDMGQEGRMVLKGDIPIMVTLGDGRVHRTTIKMLWTENGPEIASPDEQARRLAREISEIM